jgi:hypothetical protein
MTCTGPARTSQRQPFTKLSRCLSHMPVQPSHAYLNGPRARGALHSPIQSRAEVREVSMLLNPHKAVVRVHAKQNRSSFFGARKADMDCGMYR